MSQESPWTVEEAAAWLKRSEEYVRRLAREKKLPGVKDGRNWRFSPEKVRAMIPLEAAPGAVQPEVATILEARLNSAFARARRTS